jgi:hypothetical protein
MAAEKVIVETLDKIGSEVNGFIAVSLVDLDTGMTLGQKTVRPDFDLGVASAYNTEMVKQKLKIMRTLNLKGSLEDMLLTLSDQLHLIKFVTPKTFIYLAADRNSTNLAVIRTTVQKYIDTLK